jgi:hypothetical protein
MDHGPEMLVHGLFIESIYLRRLDKAAGGGYLLCDIVERRPAASGEKERCPLPSEGARHSTADRASGSVDHCNLVFEHNV